MNEHLNPPVLIILHSTPSTTLENRTSSNMANCSPRPVTLAVVTTDTSVTTKGTHTIQCAHPECLDTLPSPFILGPLDHLVYHAVPVNVVWVYEAQQTGSVLIPITRLARAISLVLDYYPHLTGRLHISPDDGTRSMTQLNSGMSLIEATCDAPLSSFRNASTGRLHMADLPAAGNALLGPWDPSLEGVQREPVFTIKHTRFACGSVSIGVRLPHTVCAAEGFLQLYQDLAELYRGLSSDPAATPTLKQPPHIRPFLADEMVVMSPAERDAALSFQPPGLSTGSLSEPPATTGAATARPPPTPVAGRELRFTAAELAALKAHATPPDGHFRVSTFSALCAHFWQRQHVARLALVREQQPRPEVSTAFLTSVNYSTKLFPEEQTPLHYFSNALMVPFIDLGTSISEEFATWPLWRVAQTVHEVCRSISPQDARDTARWVAAQPDKRTIRHGFAAGYGSLMASAWNRFPAYAGAELPDEEGKLVAPAVVNSPFTTISLMDGLMYLLPTKEDNGDVEVIISLSEPLWNLLDRDEEFRRFMPKV